MSRSPSSWRTLVQIVDPKIRVWVVFGKGPKLGRGRAQLLRLIDERGSLRRAAAEFGISYRNAWGYLQELERAAGRSEEHTSELQSLRHIVCRLLLEKK